MHVLMMALYAAITAVVLAAIESKSDTMRERVMHGLKIFGYFMGHRPAALVGALSPSLVTGPMRPSLRSSP